MNLQSKVLERLKALTTDSGLDFVEARQWDNTGTVLIQAKSDFETLIRFTYGFYDDYASIEFTRPEPQNFPYVLYTRSSAGRVYVQDVIDYFAEQLLKVTGVLA